VRARDRTGLVHFAVPLALGGEPLGALVAGQVFDSYPEQLPLDHVARKAGLSAAKVWEKARREHPVSPFMLKVYEELLATHGHIFLQGRYHTLLEATRVAQLRRVEEALREANDELEKRVEERTAQLEASNEDLKSKIAERRRAEEALRESRDRFSAIVNSAAEGILTFDGRGVVTSFNTAAERMFRYAAGEVIGQSVTRLLPPPYRDLKPEELTQILEGPRREYLRARREISGRRQDGSDFPVELVVSEIQEQGRRSFTGILRDLSETRELEKKVLEVVGEEQRRIGQDLHDNAGQVLTGLGLLAQSLVGSLTAKGLPEARTAAKVAGGLKDALGQVRAVARGLVPVEVDAAGLMAALGDLAAQTSELRDVACTFTCDEPVLVADNAVATHLFRIAREAVTNALKHARPGRIDVVLRGDNGVGILEVADDGPGMRDEDLNGEGMGLRIMRYRAGRIGGELTVGRGPRGGTQVRCTFRKDVFHEQP
jgi:PAS domain S-box-containing protein